MASSDLHIVPVVVGRRRRIRRGDAAVVQAQQTASRQRAGTDRLEDVRRRSRTPQALVVFLRGVNVGGHRVLRPSALAKDLRDYDVVNVGAAGTFVVRRPGSRHRFRAALLQRLPFDTTVVICDARDLLRLEAVHPFGSGPPPPDVVRFVSLLSGPARGGASLPIVFPPRGPWLLKVLGADGRFVFGTYRRHMRVIGYLGQIDTLFGVPATTRNWNTISTIVRMLKGG